MLLALIGVLSNQFNLMPQALNGFGGVGLFAVGGALMGGIAGGLAGQARSETTDTAPVSRLGSSAWPVATPGLFLGLVGGLAIGLTYRYIGGYLIPTGQSNPQAGMVGLLIGGASGLLAGIGIAVLWNRGGKPVSDRQAARRTVGPGAGVDLLLLGVVVLSLPYWFIPLVGLNIVCVQCH